MISFIFSAALVAILAFNVVPENQQIDPTDSPAIELRFTDHLSANLIEQDVFIAKNDQPQYVYRIHPEEANRYQDSPLYTTAEAHEHAIFDKDAIGPYQKGEPLKFRLEKWLDAEGEGDYSCSDGLGHIRAEFRELIPDAQYSIWQLYAPEPLDPLSGFIMIPVGERDGSQNAFTTDENGKAQIELKFDRCIQEPGEQLTSGVALAYHSDGKTKGALPGEFGKNVHIQLFAMFPPDDKS